MTALSGIVVLDLTQFLAGPYSTQILGDLGADIIKVEPPIGDSSRTVPPHFIAGDSAYYHCINRNKRSIVIDMRTAEGRDLVRRMALRADILVENNRPGVLDRLGLNYDDLAKQNPKLIWCSISGFGQDGPYRDRPAYDMVDSGDVGRHEHDRRAEWSFGARGHSARPISPRVSTARSASSPRSTSAIEPVAAAGSTSPCSTARSRC